MNRFTYLAGAALLTLGLTACTSNDTPAPEVTTLTSTTPSSSSTSATSTVTSPTMDTLTSTTEPVEDSAPEAAAPYVVECLEGSPGPAVWSDGTTAHSEDCWLANGGPAYAEAESQSGYDPSKDPANIPYADGGTCPAYKCGYGTDENGNANPTSGEIQFRNGCEAGYIDAAQCAARGY